MRVFVAGAGGALGRSLVPRLIEAGHAVAALTRSETKRTWLSQAGATVFIADALEIQSVNDAVLAFQPDAIVNQLTAIPAKLNLPKLDRDFTLTNQLRRQGTDNLLSAAAKVGCRRFLAQSFAGWPYARQGGPVKSEADPLDPDPPPKLSAILEAIKHLENSVTKMGGVVLRYGGFYGPGTSLAKDGSLVADVSRRRLPVVGEGTAVWSFVHLDDAASATVAALSAAPGIYNVTDDDPAPVREWLPYLALTLGAKSPLRIPVWLARIFIGEHGVILLTEARGASNEKARRELDWQPAYGSWREGFKRELGS